MSFETNAPAHGTEEVAPRASLLESLAILAQEVDEAGLTLHELMARLGERAFGAMLFALAIPCCIPFLWGVPQIVALPMMALALQMAAGRHEPWLPGKLAERRIDRAGLEGVAKGARRFFGWAERFAEPRLLFMTGPAAERIIGAVLVVFCASILTPIPGTNTLPGFAVALVAYGMMERDGLLIAFGLVLGTLWIGALGLAGFFVFDILIAEDGGVRAALSALWEMASGLLGL